MRTLLTIPVFLPFILSAHALQFRPIVLWHGMGDNCCNPDSMGKIKKSIESVLPGVYVYSIQLSDSEEGDRRSGFFGNVNDHISKVCDILENDENLRDGYNAIGFSQGGQFLRAVLQRCNYPRMYNLITFGSQHAGVADIPGCLSNDSTCQLMRSVIRRGAYTNWVQRSVVQAQYYKDFNQYDTYLERNIFLLDINNERPFPEKNAKYARNLASLEKLVLIRFTEDDIVKPRETAWFWFYDDSGELVDVHNQLLYLEDWIGLRHLEERGGVVYQDCVGKHMSFSLEYLEDYVVRPYLSTPLSHPQILVDDEGDVSSPFPVSPRNRSGSQHHHKVMVDEDGDWMVSDFDNTCEHTLVDSILGDDNARKVIIDDEGDWAVVDEFGSIKVPLDGSDELLSDPPTKEETKTMEADSLSQEYLVTEPKNNSEDELEGEDVDDDDTESDNHHGDAESDVDDDHMENDGDDDGTECDGDDNDLKNDGEKEEEENKVASSEFGQVLFDVKLGLPNVIRNTTIDPNK